MRHEINVQIVANEFQHEFHLTELPSRTFLFFFVLFCSDVPLINRTSKLFTQKPQDPCVSQARMHKSHGTKRENKVDPDEGGGGGGRGSGLLLSVLRIRPAGNVISAPAPRNITLVIRPVDQLVPFLFACATLSLPLFPFPFLSLSFFLCQIAVFHILYATKTLSTYQESVIYICQQQTVWGALSMRCTGGVWKLPSCSCSCCSAEMQS